MSSTTTRSQTSTYTEPRARYVLQKAYDDFVGLMSHSFLTKERAQKWYTDVKYIMDLEALKGFEVQVKNEETLIMAWRYDVTSDGSIYEDSDSGGMNFYSIPSGSTCSLVLSLSDDQKKKDQAWEYLRSRDWGTGTSVAENGRKDKSFSMEGYGITRKIYEVSK